MINHVTPQVHSQKPAPDQQPGATIEILRDEPCDSTRPGCMNCGIFFNSLAPFRFCSCQQNLIVAISNRVTAQGPKKRPSYLADRRTFSDLLVVDPTDYNVHRHQWEENLLPKKREMYARHINDDRDPKRDKKHSVFVKVENAIKPVKEWQMSKPRTVATTSNKVNHLLGPAVQSYSKTLERKLLALDSFVIFCYTMKFPQLSKIVSETWESFDQPIVISLDYSSADTSIDQWNMARYHDVLLRSGADPVEIEPILQELPYESTSRNGLSVFAPNTLATGLPITFIPTTHFVY